MSGGKAYDKQAAQYTGKQPGEGSVVASRDTTAAENQVYSSVNTTRKSKCLKEMSVVKQTGGKGETEKGKHPAGKEERTRTTRHSEPALLAPDAFAVVRDSGQDAHSGTTPTMARPLKS